MPIKTDQRQYRMMAAPLAAVAPYAAPHVQEVPPQEPADGPQQAEGPQGEPQAQEQPQEAPQQEQPAKRIESDFYVEGYATTFEDPYLLFEDCDGWKYYEVIDPGAFDGADMSDVILQYDHSGYVYARTSNGSLVVEPDAHGLFVAADMGRTTHAREMFEDVEAGNVTRMSWAFIPVEEEYAEDLENRVLTTRVKRVSKVFDVSAVSCPADPNTEISARKLLDGEIEACKQRESLLLAATRKRREIAMRAKAMKIR